jgi:signal transduction histidine kinase
VFAANELAFPLIIERAYYNTWWFRVLLLAVLGIAVWVGVSLRIRQLRQMAELRTKISSDLHDDVGSVLTRIALQSELARKKVKSSEVAIFESIAETSRTAISNMRDVIWSTDARNDQVSSLVDRMREHANEMLEPVNKSCRFDVQCEDEGKKLSMETRQHMYLIYKEAINNVVKHSDATEVEIIFILTGKELRLKIADNGSPQPANARSGSGLRNMRMRAARMGAEISISMVHGYVIQLSKRL